MTANRRETTYREMLDENIRICRHSYNALMTNQTEKGVLHPEILQSMDFDNSMKLNLESTRKTGNRLIRRR